MGCPSTRGGRVRRSLGFNLASGCQRRSEADLDLAGDVAEVQSATLDAEIAFDPAEDVHFVMVGPACIGWWTGSLSSRLLIRTCADA